MEDVVIETGWTLGDALARLDLGSASVKGVALLLGMPGRSAPPSDAEVAEAAGRLSRRNAFESRSVPVLRRIDPSPLPEMGPGGAIAWTRRHVIPLLPDEPQPGLRLRLALDPAPAAILDAMAEAGTHEGRLDALLDALRAEARSHEGRVRSACEPVALAIPEMREALRLSRQKAISRLGLPGGGLSLADRDLDGALAAIAPTLARALAEADALLAKPRLLRRARDVAGYDGYVARMREGREPRRVVLHLGPTNSGKTHAAMEVLLAAGSGTYLAPRPGLRGPGRTIGQDAPGRIGAPQGASEAGPRRGRRRGPRHGQPRGGPGGLPRADLLRGVALRAEPARRPRGRRPAHRRPPLEPRRQVHLGDGAPAFPGPGGDQGAAGLRGGAGGGPDRDAAARLGETRLRALELGVQLLTAYQWLARRMPETFALGEAAGNRRSRENGLIEAELGRIGADRARAARPRMLLPARPKARA